MKPESINVFFELPRRLMFRAGDMRGFPAQPALVRQDRQSPEGIAALQRNGVIENMEDPHESIFRIPNWRPLGRTRESAAGNSPDRWKACHQQTPW